MNNVNNIKYELEWKDSYAHDNTKVHRNFCFFIFYIFYGLLSCYANIPITS